jgi:DNA-directed RNA polymerase specialized sigma24 family protein
MSDSVSGSITHAFRQLRDGDPDAAARLWGSFFPRLAALARRTLAGRPGRAADAEDAVQEAFASFFRRTREGDFGDALGRDDLWRLLAAFTVRKSLRQARREAAAKRGGGAVLGEGDLTGPDGRPLALEEAAARVPAADLDLRSVELLDALDEEQRAIALLRLLGHSNREIAGRLGCTERKVERKLNLIRRAWAGASPA